MLKKIISCSVVLCCFACAILPISANAKLVQCWRYGWHNCDGYTGGEMLDGLYIEDAEYNPNTIQCKCPSYKWPDGYVYSITCNRMLTTSPEQVPDIVNGGYLEQGWVNQTDCYAQGTTPSVCTSGTTRACENITEHYDGRQTCIGGQWGSCAYQSCKSGYTRVDNKCYEEWRPDHGYGYCK